MYLILCFFVFSSVPYSFLVVALYIIKNKHNVHRHVFVLYNCMHISDLKICIDIIFIKKIVKNNTFLIMRDSLIKKFSHVVSSG